MEKLKKEDLPYTRYRPNDGEVDYLLDKINEIIDKLKELE